MDGFIQIVLDLILDGSLGAAGDRKAPTAVRVIAAVILIAAFCALAGFCVFLMIHDESWPVKGFGALILLLELHAAYKFFRALKQRKK